MKMPATWNGWRFTQVLSWWHVEHDVWQSKWLHVSELPGYSLSAYATAAWRWWFDQRFPE